jgi:hypothetical protein
MGTPASQKLSSGFRGRSGRENLGDCATSSHQAGREIQSCAGVVWLEDGDRAQVLLVWSFLEKM